MHARILAEPPLARLLTTDDVAKALGLSRSGVLKLAHRGDLAFEPTRSGQLIFHIGEVRRCELQRTDARTRSRPAVLAGLHLQMARATLEPRQLSFLRGIGLRIVTRGERAVVDRGPKVARSLDRSYGSDKDGSVNRKVATR